MLSKQVVSMRLPPLTLLTPKIAPAALLDSSTTTTGVVSSKVSGVTLAGILSAGLYTKEARKTIVSISSCTVRVSLTGS